MQHTGVNEYTQVDNEQFQPRERETSGNIVGTGFLSEAANQFGDNELASSGVWSVEWSQRAV